MDFAYEQTIENVNDILTALQEIKVHPYKASWWFRGHSKPEYKLAPSVFREFNLMGEWNLYHQFIRKAHSRYSQCPDSKDALGWLTLMQHYGLPTRLLDWSQSVLVAAFFACRSNPQENGILWGMNPSVLIKQQVPTSSEGIFPIHTPLLQENARLALMELGGKVNGTPFSVLPFYPTEIDNRMLLQQSCFTFHTVDAIN
ncbi:MAG: FRG domain-containing protein, partial [Armatimonadetes bacterium]|nr:FRG domain-containing protein [Armatimonadota bacterium]